MKREDLIFHYLEARISICDVYKQPWLRQLDIVGFCVVRIWNNILWLQRNHVVIR